MKYKIKSTIICITIFAFGMIGSLNAQIANSYPNDSLIDTDLNVLFTEMFEQDSVPAMLSTPGYQTLTPLSRIHFDPSVPVGSHGNQSLRLTTVEHDSTYNDTMEDANIRINLLAGITDSVFIRYYIKYNSAHTFHHSGVWAVGTDPSHSCWTCVYPGRFIPPGGDSAFIVGTEIRGAANQNSTTTSQFGFYNYWMGMKPLVSFPNTGKYFGDEFNPAYSNDIINMDTWNCIEIMIRLNNPVTDSTGELKLWIKGNLVGYYGQGFPTGMWNEATFVEGVGTPFEGFRWRSNPNVVLNYIWLKNYASENALYTTPNDMWIDHVVVAKNYIGPIYESTTSSLDENPVNSQLYPNPTNGLVMVECKNFQGVKVYNSFGEELFQSTSKEISLKNFPNGMYYFAISTSEGTSIQKVIKQ